jgi:hypothetical protein
MKCNFEKYRQNYKFEENDCILLDFLNLENRIKVRTPSFPQKRNLYDLRYSN